MHTFLRILALPFGIILSSVPLSAGIIVDPILATGPDSIDPPGGQDIDFTPGALTKTQLEALPGFGVIQTWTGFESKKSSETSVTNYVRFTTGTNAGLAFQFTLNHNGTSTSVGGSNSTNTFNTSPTGDAIRLGTAIGASGFQSYEITVGSHDGTTFTAGSGLAAVSFVLTNRIANNVTVSFYNRAGDLLTAQSSAGFLPSPFVAENNPSGITGNGYELLFSYAALSLSEADAIHRIVITGGQTSTDLWGLDDFGFTTAIPEPSTYAAAAGALMLGLTVASRRR